MHEAGAPGSLRPSHSPPPGLRPDALDLHTFPPPPDGQAGGDGARLRDHRRGEAHRGRRWHLLRGVDLQRHGARPHPPGHRGRHAPRSISRTAPVTRTTSISTGHIAPSRMGGSRCHPVASTTYEIVAGPAGLHPYHCHTAPLAEHIGRGLYGMLIVDPPGWAAAGARGRPLLSRVSAPRRSAATGRRLERGGRLLRRPSRSRFQSANRSGLYLVNMLEHEPVASFHLHAETFDVYPAGMGRATVVPRRHHRPGPGPAGHSSSSPCPTSGGTCSIPTSTGSQNGERWDGSPLFDAMGRSTR